MAKFDVSLLIVLTAHGLIDRKASTTKFGEYLDLQEAEQDSSVVMVSDAVNAVFEENKGARLNMPAVVSMAFPRLGVEGKDFSSWKLKIETYLRANSKEDGSFSIAKGRDGGIRRVCDTPKDEAKVA